MSICRLCRRDYPYYTLLLPALQWACQYLLYLTLDALFKLRNAHKMLAVSSVDNI